jgi:predicted  nucleic acid-binding Zn-ribbon protein
MTTQRPKLSIRLAAVRSKQQPASKRPARRFPVQREIHNLKNELDAFNERIVELEDEGHRGYAMEVLKANAMDFACRIDELRSLLIESAPKESPKGRS